MMAAGDLGELYFSQQLFNYCSTCSYTCMNKVYQFSAKNWYDMPLYHLLMLANIYVYVGK